MKPAPSNVRRDWRAFTAAVGDRLATGQRAYGDRSLAADPRPLGGEVEAELVDVCGWAFILWRRVRALRGRLGRKGGRRR